MKKQIVLLYLFLVSFSAIAQPLFFERHFGTALSDISRSVTQLPSGSVYIIGNSGSGNIGNTDIAVTKLDKYGNDQWTEYYGDANLNYGYTINKCSDGNLIILGDALVTSNDTDVLIYKIDTSGNVIWQYIYSTPLNESAKYIEQTTDGGYVAAGFQTDTSGYNNAFVVKIDASGNYLWERSIGGIDNDYASMIRQMPGGNLILTSDTRSFGAGGYDIMLTKLDADGNTIWEYTYGDSLNNGCQGIYYSSGDHFISYGETEIAPASPFDMFMEKIDTNGVSVWKKYYGSTSHTDACFSVCESFDGGYMLTGYSNSFNSGAPIDLAVVKTDTAGNYLWGRGYGNAGVDIGYQIIPSVDAGYYIVGKYYNVDLSDDEYYLLHVDKDNGGLSSVWERGQESSFVIFPNPSNGNFSIDSGVEHGNERYIVYTIEGKKLMEIILPEAEHFKKVETPFSKGIYIIEQIIENRTVSRKKLIIN